MGQRGFWQKAAAGLIRQLTEELGRDKLRKLQTKKPLKHAGLALGWLGSGVLGLVLAVQAVRPALWPFGIAVLGLFAFNGTVLLHEVLHGLVFPRLHSYSHKTGEQHGRLHFPPVQRGLPAGVEGLLQEEPAGAAGCKLDGIRSPLYLLSEDLSARL
ncbi:MAG: hypothetical protein ACK42L_11090, partial [Thermoanaerobaculum sp.]